jgi:hypothetical protein
MTAEQMEQRFGGAKYSLWNYWKNKRIGRIPYMKVINHLQSMGHQGFYREMLWHLLPRQYSRRLYSARKDGTLDAFVWTLDELDDKDEEDHHIRRHRK